LSIALTSSIENPNLQVVEHAIAVDEKIVQLNAIWPDIIAKYEAHVRTEMANSEVLMRRYRAVIHGEYHGK